MDRGRFVICDEITTSTAPSSPKMFLLKWSNFTSFYSIWPLKLDPSSPTNSHSDDDNGFIEINLVKATLGYEERSVRRLGLLRIEYFLRTGSEATYKAEQLIYVFV